VYEIPQGGHLKEGGILTTRIASALETSSLKKTISPRVFFSFRNPNTPGGNFKLPPDPGAGFMFHFCDRHTAVSGFKSRSETAMAIYLFACNGQTAIPQQTQANARSVAASLCCRRKPVE
jgi:hypothetical protein